MNSLTCNESIRITASLLREGSYSTIRMGMYDVIKDALGCTDPKSTPLWKKVLSGGTAGALGAAIANPTGSQCSSNVDI